jgi:hypothetical protein
MLKNVPLSRIVIYLLSLGLIPLALVYLFFSAQKSEIDDLQNHLEIIQNQAIVKEKKQALNLAVRDHFREADHFYIDKFLETLIFLEPEIEQLHAIVNDQNFADDERIKRRLEFLTSDSNALIFSEGVVQTFPFFQETAETLIHPVEVDAKDIQTILARIEGVKINESSPGPFKPQLVITEFKLDKKQVNDQNEVYLLNLKLLKREFL